MPKIAATGKSTPTAERALMTTTIAPHLTPEQRILMALEAPEARLDQSDCDHPVGIYEDRPWRTNDVLRCDTCGVRWVEVPDEKGEITRQEYDAFGVKVTGHYRIEYIDEVQS